jgi:hypothetical protein
MIVSFVDFFILVYLHYKNNPYNLLTGGLKMKKGTLSRKIVIVIMSLSMILLPLTSSLSMAQSGAATGAGPGSTSATGAAGAGVAGAGATFGMSTAAIVGISAAIVTVGLVAAEASSDEAAPTHAAAAHH